MIGRNHLENVVQKRKVSEVHQWLSDHFVRTPREEYMNKCPFLIIQGPTGCGKTTTLTCLARELKISVQEYSETTDTTAINYDLATSFHDDANEERAHTIDKRRAAKFERFVIEHLRFTTLYPVSDEPAPVSADSEFESDDDFPSTLSSTLPKPKPSGVIIHIESPLSFSRSQRVLAQTLFRLVKIIKDLTRTIMRRIAIVFESLECEKDSLQMPTKLKNSLRIQTIKFNPITRTHMKKFIENMLRSQSNLIVDKEAMELIINDVNGDLRACMNTFQLLCDRTTSCHNIAITNRNLHTLQLNDLSQVNKRQRLDPQRLNLHPNMLRDVTKSSGFFHLLGKIFYQKRLYPERGFNRPNIRSIDRPYRTENSTEYVMTRLDVSSKNLMAWLHQHYSQFCCSQNISKASLFLENLSDVDTISIDAMQSSQYYEMHNAIDQMQSYLAIESTVFSLYEDQSRDTKSSHKKICTAKGPFVIKSSVEKSSNGVGELYSFSRPAALSVHKLIEDHRQILSQCADQIMQSELVCTDPTKILLDYIPYLSHMSKLLMDAAIRQRGNGFVSSFPSIVKDPDLSNLMSLLNTLENGNPKLDFEEQHENLLDIIQDIEQKSKAQLTSFLDG